MQNSEKKVVRFAPFIAFLIALFLTYTHALAATSAARSNLPNIVIIFTDDQGYADVGVFGARGFQTPNLDGLAAGWNAR